MERKVLLAVVSLICITFLACPKREITEVTVAPEPDEILIWSTHEKRPVWTVSEPEMIKDEFAFVGLSGKYATEKESRDDAHRAAIRNVVRYIGTLAQDRFERLQTSYGLTTDIVNPTDVTRRFEEQLSSAFATRVKAKEWYIEKWQNKKTRETYYLSFVLSGVPKSAIEKAYEEAMDATIDDLKKKRAAASEAKAKAQFENAMKAFEEAKKQGFSLER